MKRSLTLSAMLIAAALMSGCTANNESAPVSGEGSSSGQTSTEPALTAEAPSEPAEPAVSAEQSPAEEPPVTEESLSFDIIGIVGDKVKPSDITEIHGENNTLLTLEQLTPTNWEYLRCDFAYAAPSTGICYTSIDNADIYDSESLMFRDAPRLAPSEYRRLKAGDEICGFTVKSASTDFFKYGTFAPDEDGNGTYFRNCSAEFEGSAELTGYVWIAPEDDYCVGTGDIFFVPAPGSDILPVMNYEYVDNGVKTLLFCGANNGFGWLNEYPNILLGNSSNIAADVSDVPIDGQYHKAKITIDGLSISSDIDWLSKVQCNLTELELL